MHAYNNYTIYAASLIILFAFAFHMAGIVITQVKSSEDGGNGSFAKCFISCCFKYFSITAITSTRYNFCPVTSCTTDSRVIHYMIRKTQLDRYTMNYNIFYTCIMPAFALCIPDLFLTSS